MLILAELGLETGRFRPMDPMPLHPGLADIALRLALALAAGAVIGANREISGERAGLRTNMLVALAAAVAMVETNLLLPVAGKTLSSFSQMDVMRLPLGILSGMGFIGAGAILRRGELLIGVTTTATLWVLTVIGLCFGGGQYTLGIGATVLAASIIWLLKAVDRRFAHTHRAVLKVHVLTGIDVRALVERIFASCQLTLMDLSFDDQECIAIFEAKWTDHSREGTPVGEMTELRQAQGVQLVSWRAMVKRV